MIHNGKMRVSFNRHHAEGRVWAVASCSGLWEVTGQRLFITTDCVGVYEPKDVPDDEDGRPSAWFETTGLLTLSPGGVLRIDAAPSN